MGERRNPGLTWRSALALLFSLALVEPMMIYSYLVTGVTLPIQIGWWPWIVVLVWSEISRFMGSPLRKQELFIILSFQWIASFYSLFFLEPVQNMYRSYSAEAKALGVTQHVPRWWVPSMEDAERLMAEKWLYLDPAWAVPVTVQLLFLAFNVAATVSLGYLAYTVYVQMQKREFPLASAQAGAVLILAEREPSGTRFFMVSALLGMVGNLFTSFLPFLLGPFLSGGGLEASSSVVAAQTFDMSPYLAHLLPGVAFAFTVNGPMFASGIILPLWVTVAQFAGAFSYYGIGTHLITRMGLWPKDSPYNVSWTLPVIVERSQIHFYISTTLGLSLAAIIVPLAVHWRRLVSAFKISPDAEVRGPPFRTVLATFLCASAGSVLLTNYLTGFPIWLLAIFVIGGSFFASFLSANSAGITLAGFSVTWLPQYVVFSANWPDKSIWFAPISMYAGGADIAMAFKQADILEADHREYVKTYLVLIAFSLMVSVAFVSYLWSISPIPSGAYPATVSVWPVEASSWARQQVWFWTGYIFKPDKVAASFIIGTLVYLVSDFLLHKPGILISFIAGTTPSIGIVGSASQLIGSIFGRIAFKPLVRESQGIQSFIRRAPQIYMGVSVGWGFLETIRVLLIIMGKAMWLLPY
ncbi:MAG: hypothetical protein JTT11_02675 [Candidatus Brockarchaeota archaeon]|nr:hypothetical protein [Candidatus Brockarchaeota archaeon]